MDFIIITLLHGYMLKNAGRKWNFSVLSIWLPNNRLYFVLNTMYPLLMDVFLLMFDRANPVQAESHDEFSQWLCHVHNVVNRR